MTNEEYSAKIDALIKSKTPEADALELMEAIKTDKAHEAEQDATIKSQTEKIASLTESNNRLYNKLFVAQTGHVEEHNAEQHEETPRERFNRLFDEKYYPKKEGEK